MRLNEMKSRGSQVFKIALLVSSFFASCGPSQLSRAVQTSPPTTKVNEPKQPLSAEPGQNLGDGARPTYINFVKPQMSMSCLTCHAQGQALELHDYGVRKSDVTFSRWQKVVSKVSQGSMPPSGPLQAAVIERFNQWAALGYPFDESELSQPVTLQPCGDELLPARLWRLTVEQAKNSAIQVISAGVSYSLKLPTVERTAGTFRSQPGRLSVSGQDAYDFIIFGESIGNFVGTYPEQILSKSKNERLSSCLNASNFTCQRDYISEIATDAWRRPLANTELNELDGFYKKALADGQSKTSAISMVVAFIFNSPKFWYRSEIGEPQGNGIYKLTGYEVASFLSYSIWNSSPDAALFVSAKEGRLSDPVGIRKEIDRMIASTKFNEGLWNFFDEWLGLGFVRAV
ncbi:MAG: DUF1592 domain-containing protein, partial [Proteobacteria bacterium]|nr:DUF1592 domain-containing protein [Pseudomonadota bacterium]